MIPISDLIREYFAPLTDEQIRDQYAMMLGYCVRPGAPYRYETIRGNRVYHLVSLPSRAEMVEELSR